MISCWAGTSRTKPVVVRFRSPEGDYGLRVLCWHGKTAELVYPHREVIESWEQSVSLNPCRWVPACPEYHRLLRWRATRD